MMSEFMNDGDDACPLSDSIVKITALWLLSLIRIRGMLTVDKVNILTISEFKLIKTISDVYYNYFSRDYSKCTNTDTAETDSNSHPIELIIL